MTRAAIEQILDESLTFEDPQIKTYTYVLDNNQMVGNPYNFISPTTQYGIYPIDIDNFLYIDSIVFFSTGFEETTADEIKLEENGNDIYLHDIQIYALGELTSVSGDYRMEIQMPQGTTLRTINESELLNVNCKTKYKNADITEKSIYYWFKKDNKVKIGSDGYLAYGGAGWRYLESKGAQWKMTTNGAENKAYENTYKVLCIYKNSVNLLQQFTIYNESCKRDIEIISDLGTKFSFDRGNPVLTCRINQKESGFDDTHKDNLFRFVWSKVEPQVAAVIYDETYAEVEAKYKDLKLSVLERQSYKRQMAQLESVKFWDGSEFTYAAKTNCNKLQYAVSGISSTATFTCDVYLKDNELDFDDKEYNIGSASITLSNENTAIPSEYNIVLENGSQVFQYSEMGVTPASANRNENPIEVRPLIPHFYDPTGLEVNSSTYTVKWKVPLENTMIYLKDIQKELQVDPATGKADLYYNTQFPLAIFDNYDYSALNNQVKCIVEYHNQTYYQNSDLFFTKVGENGTNGTDIVAVISPTDTNPTSPVKQGDEPLTAIVDVIEEATGDGVSYKYENNRWNTGQVSGESVVQLHLYQRNEDVSSLMDSEPIEWTVAGSKSSCLSCEQDGEDKSKAIVRFAPVTATKTKTTPNRNQIIKGIGRITKVEESKTKTDSEGREKEAAQHTSSVERTKQYYYAFLPIPSIEYHYAIEDTQRIPGLKISINKTKTMKSVLYDASGQNPQYDKNQGVCVKFTLNDSFSGSNNLVGKYIVIETIGGMNDTENGTSLLSLSKEKNSKRKTTFSDKENITITSDDVENGSYELFRYIHPADDFSGAYTNNMVHISVFRNENQKAKSEVEIFIPIHCSLNTHGLASLNAWDGTSVDVNEEGGYILAPQIGAGEKTWEKKGEVYSSETISSIDPADNYTNVFSGILMGVRNTYNGMTDGLSTSGDSTTKDIGLFGYSKGRQSIFLNAMDGSATFGLPENRSTKDNKYTEGQIKLVPGGISNIANWKIGSRILYNVVRGNSLYDNGEEPDVDESPYSNIDKYQITDTATNKYTTSIPAWMSGILLSANPSYISIKGAELIRTSKNLIDFDSANAVVKPGDSFELQLDPNQQSLFSIYTHSASPENYNYQVYEGSKKNEFEIRDKNEQEGKDKNIYTKIVYNELGNSNEKLSYVFYKASPRIDGENEAYLIASLDIVKNEYKWTIRKVQKDKIDDKVGNSQQLSDLSFTEKELALMLEWNRYQRVGIDDKGRFFTNALKDGQAATYLGPLPGFGKTNDDNAYYGAQFEIGSEARNTDSLIKFFVDRDKLSTNVNDCDLYVSGSSQLDNEYNRSIKMYFKDFELNASQSKNKTKNTEYQIAINNDRTYLGHKHYRDNVYAPADSSWIELNNSKTVQILGIDGKPLRDENNKIITKNVVSTIFSGAAPLEIGSHDNDTSLKSQTFHQRVIAPGANESTSKYLDEHVGNNISYETKIKGNKLIVLDGNENKYISGNYSFVKTISNKKDKIININNNQIVIGDNIDSSSNSKEFIRYGRGDSVVSHFITKTEEGGQEFAKIQLDSTGNNASEILSSGGLYFHTAHAKLGNGNTDGVCFKLDEGNFRVVNQAPNAKNASVVNEMYLENPSNDGNTQYSFTLATTNGTMNMKRDLWTRSDGSKVSGLALGQSTYLGAPAGYFDKYFFETGDKDGGQLVSVWAERDIYTRNGWMYSNNFYFNDYSWDSNFDNWSGHDHHLLTYIIYALNHKINNNTDTINWHWESGDSNSNNVLRNDVNTAQMTADNANTNANNRVDWNSYNNKMASVDSNIEDIWTSLKGNAFIGAINQAGALLAGVRSAEDWNSARSAIADAGTFLNNLKL